MSSRARVPCGGSEQGGVTPARPWRWRRSASGARRSCTAHAGEAPRRRARLRRDGRLRRRRVPAPVPPRPAQRPRAAVADGEFDARHRRTTARRRPWSPSPGGVWRRRCAGGAAPSATCSWRTTAKTCWPRSRPRGTTTTWLWRPTLTFARGKSKVCVPSTRSSARAIFRTRRGCCASSTVGAACAAWSTCTSVPGGARRVVVEGRTRRCATRLRRTGSYRRATCAGRCASGSGALAAPGCRDSGDAAAQRRLPGCARYLGLWLGTGLLCRCLKRRVSEGGERLVPHERQVRAPQTRHVYSLRLQRQRRCVLARSLYLHATRSTRRSLLTPHCSLPCLRFARMPGALASMRTMSSGVANRTPLMNALCPSCLRIIFGSKAMLS